MCPHSYYQTIQDPAEKGLHSSKNRTFKLHKNANFKRNTAKRIYKIEKEQTFNEFGTLIWAGGHQIEDFNKQRKPTSQLPDEADLFLIKTLKHEQESMERV